MMNNSFKINNALRVVLWIIGLISLVLYFLKIISALIPGYVLIFLGMYIFMAALYFKKTVGLKGVEVGKKNFQYLYWAWTYLFFISGYGVVLLYNYYNITYPFPLYSILLPFIIGHIIIFGISKLNRL